MLVIPELPEGFFEHVGFVQALIGLEQERQGAPAVQIEISFMRQKRVALSFNEALILGRDPGVFLTPNLVEGVRQVPQNMELVEDDFGLGGVVRQRVPKRLPHVHDRQAQRAVPPGPHGVEKPVHVLFGSAQLLTHPDRSVLVEVGDHDGVPLPFLDRDFIDADGPQALLWHMLGPEIPHVADIHAPDLIPTEMVEPRDLLDGHRPTEPADRPLEPRGETSRCGQPGQGFPLHTMACAAVHPAILEFQVHPDAPGIDIAHLMHLTIVKAARGRAA